MVKDKEQEKSQITFQTILKQINGCCVTETTKITVKNNVQALFPKCEILILK